MFWVGSLHLISRILLPIGNDNICFQNLGFDNLCFHVANAKSEALHLQMTTYASEIRQLMVRFI